MQRDMEGVDVEEFPPPANVDGEAPDDGPRAVHAAADRRPPARRSRPGRRADDADRAADPDADRRRRPPQPAAADRRRRRRPRRRRRRPAAADAAAAAADADRSPATGRAGSRPAATSRSGPGGDASRAGDARVTPGGRRRPGPPHPRRPGRRRAQRGRRRAGRRRAPGRHRWWTPVRVVLALTAVCFALGHGAEGQLLRRTPGSDGRPATPTCATPTCPTSTPGAGFAELRLALLRRRPGAGPLRGDGVPRRHLLLRLGDGRGSRTGSNGSPDLDRARRQSPADALVADPEVRAGDPALRRGQRARASRRCALLAAWFLAGVNPRPALGRGALRALAGAGC